MHRFPFGGLSRRIYLAFLAAAVVPMAAAGIVGVYFSLQTLKTETLSNLDQEVSIRAQGIGRFLGQLTSELRYLAASPTLLALRQSLARGSGPAESARLPLEREYASLASLYPHVYQLRFLSDDGTERVRVDRIGQEVRIVAADQLQDKSDRYYFRQAAAMADGAIYVSPLDLNIEFGRVEKPERPVIRVAIRIGPRPDATGGVLIANLHADILVEQIQQMADAREGTAFLFDRAGYFLSREGGDATGTAAFSMLPVSELEARFGAATVAAILAAQGTVGGAGSIFAARPVALPDSTGNRVDEGRWVLALAYPEGTLFARVLNLYVLYGALLLALAATAVGGFVLSHRLLGPLDALSRESEALAQGDFSRRVHIPGADEVAALGARFNTMAERLQSLYASLQKQRDGLEVEVRARTADLERERAFLATLFQHLGDGVLEVSSGGRIRLANPHARRLLGIGGAEPGRPAALADHLPGWGELQEELGGADEVRRDLESGGRILSVSASRYEEGYVIIARDVTDERQMADQRRELDRQMFQMEKMVTLGELAMGLAHEIGNPLAGMKAVTQAMQYEEDIPQGLREALKRMEREVDRLSRFLKTFHGYAAPQPLQLGPCALPEVLDDVLFWARKEATQKGIRIETELEGELRPLRADGHGLKQVLLNLVVNAMHATPERGRITLAATMEDRQALIRVSDSGAGIAPEVLPRIFDPFFTTRSMGSGLGLAIVRKIVQQHGAEIAVESTPGQGTTFTLHWPTEAPRGA